MARRPAGAFRNGGGPGAATGPEGAASGEHPAAHTAEHSSETLLGINPEAVTLVVAAVALSVVLAALILTVRSPILAAAIAVTMLAFTVLDIREMTHQLNEAHPGLAALAATIGVLHLLAGAAALMTIRGAHARPGTSAA